MLLETRNKNQVKITISAILLYPSSFFSTKLFTDFKLKYFYSQYTTANSLFGANCLTELIHKFIIFQFVDNFSFWCI